MLGSVGFSGSARFKRHLWSSGTAGKFSCQMKPVEHLAEGAQDSPGFYSSQNWMTCWITEYYWSCIDYCGGDEVLCFCGFRVWTLFQGSKERRGFWDFLDSEWVTFYICTIDQYWSVLIIVISHILQPVGCILYWYQGNIVSQYF